MPGKIRTFNNQIRSLILYPVEIQAHDIIYFTILIINNKLAKIYFFLYFNTFIILLRKKFYPIIEISDMTKLCYVIGI